MDSVFFVASKLFWLFARPESWLVLFLLLAVGLVQIGAVRWARRFLWLSLAFVLSVGALPIGALLIAPLEARFPPKPPIVDPAGIIVLGGAEDSLGTALIDLPEVNAAAERFMAASALGLRHPQAKLVFTGGSGRLIGRQLGGAEVAAMIFDQAGHPPDQVVIEGQSRNTAENARLTRDLIAPGPGPWVLVTSAFHMPRAVGTFCATGWTGIVPYPVDYRGPASREVRWDLAINLDVLNTAIKEWIGLAAYRATGRLDDLLPQGCP